MRVFGCDDPLPAQHHSYRTFQGITCLMQISTRYHDYLIDTLLVRHRMHILLDPFTDPNIVKVTPDLKCGEDRVKMRIEGKEVNELEA